MENKQKKQLLYLCLCLAALATLLIIATLISLLIPWNVVAPSRSLVVMILGGFATASAVATGVCAYIFRPVAIWKELCKAAEEQAPAIKRRPQWSPQISDETRKELRKLFPVSENAPNGWRCSEWNEQMRDIGL